MHVSNLFRSIFSQVYRKPIGEGEDGGAPDPATPQPTPALSGRNAAMAQIVANAESVVAPDLADFDEEAGTSTPRPAAHQPEPEPEPDDSVIFAPAEEPQAQEPEKPRMVPIVVDGQTIEVEESRIIESGKRTLQKETAADRRLQEANQRRQEAEELLRRARAAAAAAGVEHQTQAPSQDAPYQPSQATQVDPAALLNELGQRVRQDVLAQISAQQAVDKFREEFPEIAADPNLWQVAISLEQRRLEEAAALGEPTSADLNAYRKHGNEIRAWLTSKAPAPQPTPAVSQDRQERKRTITAIPAVTAKPAAPAAPKTLTVAEQIEQMRLQRKQGRPINQTMR